MGILQLRASVLGGGAMLAVLLLGLGVLLAGPASPALAGPWPRSAEQPVPVLGFPSLESTLAARRASALDGLRFAAFGDQRALADGEWQAIVAAIAAQSATDSALCLVVDTGDIVNDGGYSDQFSVLAGILAPLRALPYCVAVGNHEVANDTKPIARDNTARFLTGLDPELSAERMYYCKDLPGARLIFLDSNALVYGKGRGAAPAPARVQGQLDWLAARLADAPAGASRIVVMHHPLVQSSSKHREHAVALWSLEHRGRRLPDILLDGGVDLILAGHTHTYERFTLTRSDGRHLELVNLSGRPRSDFLWFGRSARRAKDIAGRELSWLADKGWRNLADWRIEQRAAMVENESNQFGIFTVTPAGRISLEMCFLDERRPEGLRREPPLPIN